MIQILWHNGNVYFTKYSIYIACSSMYFLILLVYKQDYVHFIAFAG